MVMCSMRKITEDVLQREGWRCTVGQYFSTVSRKLCWQRILPDFRGEAVQGRTHGFFFEADKRQYGRLWQVTAQFSIQWRMSDCMHSGSVVLKFGVRSLSYFKYIVWNNTEMKRLPMTTDWKCRREPAVGVFLFPFLLSWLCFHLQTRPHVELDELL